MVAPTPTAWKTAVSQPRPSMKVLQRSTVGVVVPYEVRAQRGREPATIGPTWAMATIPAAALATIRRVTTLMPCSRVGLTM